MALPHLRRNSGVLGSSRTSRRPNGTSANRGGFVSIQAMGWVLGHSQSEGSDRLVLLAIANHADADGGLAFPSVAMIGEEARVDRATVFRALARLEQLGELEIVRGRGRGMRNTYCLKRLQDATLDRVAPRNKRVASDAQKGRSSATQNRQEPSLTAAGSHSATVREPSRCVTCGVLEFDCLCDRGPLIQGVGR